MAPVAVHLTGPEAVVEKVFGAFPGLYRSFRVDIEKLHDAGDTVFMVGHYAGTSNRGEDFRVRVTHRWTLGDGAIKIV
jgi:ketosteroid isomerase-like protein